MFISQVAYDSAGRGKSGRASADVPANGRAAFRRIAGRTSALQHGSMAMLYSGMLVPLHHPSLATWTQVAINLKCIFSTDLGWSGSGSSAASTARTGSSRGYLPTQVKFTGRDWRWANSRLRGNVPRTVSD